MASSVALFNSISSLAAAPCTSTPAAGAWETFTSYSLKLASPQLLGTKLQASSCSYSLSTRPSTHLQHLTLCKELSMFRPGLSAGELCRQQRLLKRGISASSPCPRKVNGYFSVSGSFSGATEEGDTSMSEAQTSFPRRIAQFQDAFWRFLRPHTIRGTIIGTTAVVVRALIDNSHLIDWGLLPKALRGLLALLCGNGYIVGINQIYDIGIDKVNKPFLPVAAGDLSVPAAWALVVFLASMGIIIVATNFGPLITGLYTLGLFLGAIYSVPPLRFKRFAVAAFLIIATVRGFLLNFGVYYATRASLGLAFTWSPPILFITFFVTLFATVIAITKDLPDVEGDRKFQISTFATKLGVRNIAFLGSGLLLLNYIGAIIAAYVFPQVFRKAFMVVGHSVLASALIYQTWLLDASKYSKEAIAVYYRFIWNLFYAEYALFPFI